MSQGKLVDVTILTNNIGYPDGKKGRGGKKIDKIFVHHMAGNLTVEQCGRVFKNNEVSAHYGIDNKGRVGQYVKEEDTAWHCGNKAYNQRSIGIELANDGGAKANWHVSDKVIKKCIDLIVDICQRNGIKKINYTGDLKGNLCMHCWTASTACPGGYLKGKFKYIAKKVNEKLEDEMKAIQISEPYTGELPSLHLKKSNKEVIADAITWAKKIAKSKNFHYGKGRHAHHNGCYYCETQLKSKQKAGIKLWKKTYCCNPFVHAAFAHGGCVPEMLDLCRKGKSYGFSISEGYEKSSLFKKVSLNALKKGDVLCSDGHVALYIGSGKVIHAGNEDDNVIGSKLWIKSIGIGKWKGYKRAYRYIGSVDKKMSIRHGEYSERVKHLQEFLNWWGSFGLNISGLFNDKTLKAVKKFQKSVGLKATGKVDTKTVAKMKSASRMDI